VNARRKKGCLIELEEEYDILFFQHPHSLHI